MIAFDELLKKVRGEDFQCPERLLCLDPGHTTGWCLFEKGILTKYGQSMTVINRRGNNEGTIDWGALDALFEETRPTHVVCEDYRVYAHKLERHTNSQVLTIRVIGVIDYFCRSQKSVFALDDPIPIHYQLASVAKGFCADDKLKAWDFWKDGMRHSRDAIRHGCYLLLFNKEIQ